MVKSVARAWLPTLTRFHPHPRQPAPAPNRTHPHPHPPPPADARTDPHSPKLLHGLNPNWSHESLLHNCSTVQILFQTLLQTCCWLKPPCRPTVDNCHNCQKTLRKCDCGAILRFCSKSRNRSAVTFFQRFLHIFVHVYLLFLFFFLIIGVSMICFCMLHV